MINRKVARSISWTRHNPSGVLLVIQIAALIGFPLLGNNEAGKLGLATMSLVVLAIATWAVYHSPVVTYVAICAGIPAFVFAFLEAFFPQVEWIAACSAGFHAIFYLYTSYAMIRYVLSDRKVSSDEIYSTIAAFTVILWAFAYLFNFIDIIVPQSFSEFPETNVFFSSLFLSFSALTSVGLSDIHPTGDWGRVAFMLAELIGVLYLAFVVGRVVTMSLFRDKEARSRGAQVQVIKEKEEEEPFEPEPVSQPRSRKPANKKSSNS